MSVRLSSPEDYAGLLEKYDTWMFDCDGVIWSGDHSIEGAIQVLDILRSRSMSIANQFISVFIYLESFCFRRQKGDICDQQCCKVSEDIQGKVWRARHRSPCGKPLCHGAVFIDAHSLLGRDLWLGICFRSLYILRHEPTKRPEGLCDWYVWYRRRAAWRGCILHRWNGAWANGIILAAKLTTPSQDPADCTLEPFSLANFTLDTKVGAVLCGLDMNINYTKLAKAFQYLTRNPGCQFLATNQDSTYPVLGGQLPGAGSISAPLRYALGKDPISIGKPASTMLDVIKAK